MNINQINPLVLAYIGDSIYEFYVRKYLVSKNINKVNELQIEAKKYVSAVSQAKYLEYLSNNDTFTEDEIELIKRARNTKINSHPKNTNVITYHHATSLEALIGYLYLLNKEDRIKEIMSIILEGSNV